jgi:hypothetical protein
MTKRSCHQFGFADFTLSALTIGATLVFGAGLCVAQIVEAAIPEDPVTIDSGAYPMRRHRSAICAGANRNR